MGRSPLAALLSPRIDQARKRRCGTYLRESQAMDQYHAD